MSEYETHDMMSVNSFSQLPFIGRPSMAKPSNSGTIRLFGFELELDSSPSKVKNLLNIPSETNNSTESLRKFECHYCCRNFPTSQALGGHQNAHKRERQQAKRAHLQSVMAASRAHQQGRVYGILDYHSMGSSRTGSYAGRFGHEPALMVPPPHYPVFYGRLGLMGQPMNGSPLPAGLWGPVNVTGVGVGPTFEPALGRGVDENRQLVNGSHDIGSVVSGAKEKGGVSLDLHL